VTRTLAANRRRPLFLAAVLLLLIGFLKSCVHCLCERMGGGGRLLTSG
jgi:hypothetical protein